MSPQSRAVLFDNYSAEVMGCGSSGVGAIQLGPDGKMYVVNWGDSYLHVIHHPNAGGPAANFVRNGLFLGNTSGGLGLPNFIESYFYPTPAVRTCAVPVINADFGHDDGCAGQPVRFVDQSAADPPAFLCYEWGFRGPRFGKRQLCQHRQPGPCVFRPRHLPGDPEGKIGHGLQDGYGTQAGDDTALAPGGPGPRHHALPGWVPAPGNVPAGSRLPLAG
jgi:hypothetical protein